MGGLQRTGSFPWCDWYYDVHILSYSVDENSVFITFSTLWSECGFTYWWEWECTLLLTFKGLSTAERQRIVFDEFGNARYDILRSAGVELRLWSTMSDRHPVDPPGFGSASPGDTISVQQDLDPYFWEDMFLSRAVRVDGTSGFPDVTSFSRRPYLWDFSKRVERYFGDIRLSSYLSASDALDQISGGIDDNLVETLGEADEVLTLLPGLIESSRDIIRLAKNPSEVTIRGVLDIIASLRLQQKFALEPDFQLVTEVLPRMESVARRIQKLASSGEVIGRGSFTYEFPLWEFGRENSKLVTRSKVISSRDSKALLEKALGVRALGLLPSPSSLWDLVPFSFVVDWFTDIGGRLRDLESAGFLALMNIQCYTHSYTISSSLTDDELAKDGLVSASYSGSKRPEVRYYAREVSSCVPRISDGRYDFRLPGRLPNWLTAGSLIWQLIFAKR
jgi:hypothetical protein